MGYPADQKVANACSDSRSPDDRGSSQSVGYGACKLGAYQTPQSTGAHDQTEPERIRAKDLQGEENEYRVHDGVHEVEDRHRDGRRAHDRIRPQPSEALDDVRPDSRRGTFAAP